MTSSTPATADDAARPASGHRGAALVPAAVAVVVAGAWYVALAATGSTVSDLLGWTLGVLVGVLAPGFVVVRVCRRATAPLVEDLAWATAAGCLVALFAWLLDRVLPVSPGPWLLGPVIVVVGLVVRPARRRLLARPAPGWGAGPTLALGAVLLVAIGWMLATGLLAYPADPGRYGQSYYPDILYQLDLLGSLRHSVVPSYPAVAGTSLSYHWFLYAITANLTTHTGVGLFDSTLRLGPATLVPGILVLSAVVARRLSARVWAGPLAAALLGVVDISVASRWTTEDGSLGILPRIWRSSPPQAMGWLASLAAVGVLLAYLRRAPEDRAVPVALLLPFLLLTAGSKSSELPVMMCGVALAAGVQLLRRDWATLRRCVVAGALMLGVFVLASVTIYGSNSYGVQRQPFGVALNRMPQMFPGRGTTTSSLHLTGVQYPTVAIATVSVMFVLPLLPRLLGTLLQVRYRAADPGSWVCLGTAVAGLVLPYLFRHPAGSEVYFMLSAYPIGVVGAASGLVLAGERARRHLPGVLRGRRLAVWLGALVVVGALSAAVVAWSQPRFDPVTRGARRLARDPNAKRLSTPALARRWITPDLTLLVVLAVLTLLVVGAVLAAVALQRRSPSPATDGGRPRGTRMPLILLSTMCLLLGTGLLATTLQFHGTDEPVQGSVAAVKRATAPYRRGALPPTTREMIAAGRLVDRVAGPDDVVATNMYCRFTPRAIRRGKPCDARNFIASAFTQRRSLVGGWGYADRVVGSAWTLDVAYRNAPFWDQALLQQEKDAVAHPTAALLDQLYRQHQVRWVLVDPRMGPVDVTALDRLAVSRFHSPSADLWQLRAPSTQAG